MDDVQAFFSSIRDGITMHAWLADPWKCDDEWLEQAPPPL
jgi:hypothetical protein